MRVSREGAFFSQAQSLHKAMQTQKSVVDKTKIFAKTEGDMGNRKVVQIDDSALSFLRQVKMVDDPKELDDLEAIFSGANRATKLVGGDAEGEYAFVLDAIAQRRSQLMSIRSTPIVVPPSRAAKLVEAAVETAFADGASFQSGYQGESANMGPKALEATLNAHAQEVDEKTGLNAQFVTDVKNGRTNLHLEIEGMKPITVVTTNIDMASEEEKALYDAIPNRIAGFTDNDLGRRGLEFLLTQQVLDEGPVRVIMGAQPPPEGFQALTAGEVTQNVVQFARREKGQIHVLIRNMFSVKGVTDSDKTSIAVETVIEFDISINRKRQFSVANYTSRVEFPR